MVSSTRPFDPAIRPCLCMPRTAGHQTPAPLPPRALHDTRRRDTRHQTPESHARMWAPSTHRRAPDTRHQTLIQKGAEHSPACTRHQTPDTRHSFRRAPSTHRRASCAPQVTPRGAQSRHSSRWPCNEPRRCRRAVARCPQPRGESVDGRPRPGVCAVGRPVPERRRRRHGAWRGPRTTGPPPQVHLHMDMHMDMHLHLHMHMHMHMDAPRAPKPASTHASTPSQSRLHACA